MTDPATHAQRTERYNLQALYETSRLLSSSLDLDFVLNNLLLTAMSKLLVTRGAVWLCDPVEEGAYRIAAKKGVGATDDVLRLEDAQGDGMLYGADVPETLRTLRVELAIPIWFGEREIGLVGLGKKATGRPYDERELEFVRSLVHMSASAVHNSLVVGELRRANRDLDAKIQELNTLFDLSQSFNASVERGRLLKLLSFALMGQMLVGKHLFMMRRMEADEDGDEAAFEVIAAKGLVDKELEPDLVDALCGLDDPLLLEEADDEALLRWALFQKRGLVLALPLRQQGETCGVLCLGPKMTGQPYATSDLEFLYALGNLALVSLQNSYLVEAQIEKERLEEEMRLAKGIQQGLLPQTIPTLPGIEVAAFNRPSREVGGDYFDVVRLDDHRLLTMVADVTGKGIPASLLMANLQACLRVMLPMELTLKEVTAHMNRVICDNTSASTFITSFAGIADVRDGAYRYVNAGHNPPMHLKANGAVELLEKGGLLLGVMKGMPYEQGTARLEAGDVLALFTDGVTEAMSPDEEEYGEARLEACLKAHREASAQAILDAVYADVRRFTHDPASLSDDLTMIVLKVRTSEGMNV